MTAAAASGVAILGLPATTFYALVAGIIIAVPAGLYFVRTMRRAGKKP